MKLSVIYSIYNRSYLFSRALRTVDWQTMDKKDFELIVVDDGSTEDIEAVLAPYIGKMNIRYVRYDRKKHPIWHEMNPDGITGNENWYHTQAISANIGISLAKGEITCISQPEMLHNPDSFVNGHSRAMDGKQIFSEVHWGTQLFNEFLEKNDWEMYTYDSLLEIAKNFGEEYTPNHMPHQDHYEMYWYTEYFPTHIARQINGVDLLYQRGVYAEDDQFRARMRMAGVEDKWGGRLYLTGLTKQYCVGIHQSHMDEGSKDKKQDRQSAFWNAGANHNRELWRRFCSGESYTVANENLSYHWDGQFLIEKDNYYGISE